MKVLEMIMKGGRALLVLGVMSVCVNLGAAEQPQSGQPATDVDSEFVKCTMPRPEICYEIYQPVCAVRDTGVRCVTTPCPSTEKVTYPNDCQACADPAVYGFQRGDCDAINTSGLERRLERLING